jgi:hypothetical protein
VGERRRLGEHPLHDPGGGVADRGHGDARAEVDERVAVDVLEDAAAGRGDEDRERGADAVGDVLLLALQSGQALGSGDLGDEAALLGQAGAAGGGGGDWWPPTRPTPTNATDSVVESRADG